MALRFVVPLVSVAFTAEAVQFGMQRVRQEAASNVSFPDVSKIFGLFGMNQAKPIAYNDIFMRYMPAHDVVVCGCAKCGTSSLYEFIYEHEFEKNWQDVYGGSAPYVHEVESDRWGGKFKMVSDTTEQAKLMKDAFSFAIIRDPRERLLSAWKSKIACGCGGEQCDFFTDVRTRPSMVKSLLELAGANKSAAQEGGKCMDFDHFLRVISKIHQDGNAMLLDRHFLPMSMGCFFEYPPSSWSKIVTLKRPGALADLAKKIGSKTTTAPDSHSSVGKVMLSAEAVALLDEITVPEYELVGDYLEREKSYLVGRSYPLKPGIWA